MKKLFKYLSLLFSRIFKGAQAILEKYADPAVEAVNAIKVLMDSQLPATFAEIIPGKWDDNAINNFRKILPKVALSLRLLKCGENGTANEIVQCIVETLRGLDVDGRKANYLSLAALFAFYMSDGKLTRAEAFAGVQIWYEQKYGKAQ